MFRFAHPIYLYLLAILPVLALFYLYVVVAGKKAIKRFGDPMLVSQLMIVGLFASMQIIRAADSVYVQNPQIPILIDRTDNVLFRIRIPDATKGDVLNRLTIRFGNEDKLSEVKAVRLFYAGTEAATKGRSRFAPVTYVSSHNIRNTHSTNQIGRAHV